MPIPKKGAVTDERIILVVPKNTQTEHRVMAKGFANKNAKTGQESENAFIDIREWWYANGPENEPVATKKGTMVHRKYVGALVVALLKELTGGELEMPFLDQCKEQVERIEHEMLNPSEPEVDSGSEG